jgi:serine/threonine protein phosphatase 1
MRHAHSPGRIFAVGDIHGCYQKLKGLLERLPIDPDQDFLIFLGDYLNRGPESRQVVSFLLEVKRKVRNTLFLLGNHEYELLRYARSGDPDDLRNLRPLGVEATLQSYGDSPVRSLRGLSFLPQEHRVFLEGLRTYFRLNDYLFIHAGIIPGEDLDTCPLDRLLTVRDTFLSCRQPLDATVVFGHTPFATPFVTADKIGIDTGAVHGNLLTAVELPALHFYHA